MVHCVDEKIHQNHSLIFSSWNPLLGLMQLRNIFQQQILFHGKSVHFIGLEARLKLHKLSLKDGFQGVQCADFDGFYHFKRQAYSDT